MPTLTKYLQQEFTNRCPSGWKCEHECRLLTPELEQTLGYFPRADLLLEKHDGSRRFWIEFEVSRADPVANHAKFATGHLFQPQSSTDVFISMVSSNVGRGRRNLAFNAIYLMRHIGMKAFQTVLLPQLSSEEIKRLNHMRSLENEKFPVQSEIERIFTVSDTILTTEDRHIHFASDIFEVMLNLKQWNCDLSASEGRGVWGRRTVTYFVHDPSSGEFAPSKFCAYVAIPTPDNINVTRQSAPMRSEMTVNLYATLDHTDSRFDGYRAQVHLRKHLGMAVISHEKSSAVEQLFRKWLEKYSDSITIHPRGPIFLTPPRWFK